MVPVVASFFWQPGTIMASILINSLILSLLLRSTEHNKNYIKS